MIDGEVPVGSIHGQDRFRSPQNLPVASCNRPIIVSWETIRKARCDSGNGGDAMLTAYLGISVLVLLLTSRLWLM
jgi:hypothetical protein